MVLAFLHLYSLYTAKGETGGIVRSTLLRLPTQEYCAATRSTADVWIGRIGENDYFSHKFYGR